MYQFHKHKSNKVGTFAADETDGHVPDGTDQLEHGLQVRRARSVVLKSGKGHLRGPVQREKLSFRSVQHFDDTKSCLHKQQLVHRSAHNAVHAGFAEDHEGTFEIDDSRIRTK